MSSRIHNIFSDTGCINKDILIRYHRSGLSGTDKHEVERHLVDCELCSDALEGLDHVSSADIFDKVGNEVRRQTLSGTRVKYMTPARVFLAAASISGIAFLTYVALDLTDDASVQEQVLTQAEKDTPAETTEMEIPMPEQSVIAGSDDSEPSPPEPIETVPAREKTSDPVAVRSSVADKEPELLSPAEITDSESEEEFIPPGTVAEDEAEVLKEEELKPAVTFSGQGTSLSGPSGSNVSYINDYKVYMDPVNTESVSKMQYESKSISPQHENKKAATQADESPVIRKEISYEQALRSALTEYENANYKSSIDQFNVINKSYPNDHNAAFYTGMSNYHIGNYEEALKILKPISRSGNNIFREEAEYYTALSNFRGGNESKGIRMLDEISRRGGFYAKAAEEFLEKNGR